MRLTIIVLYSDTESIESTNNVVVESAVSNSNHLDCGVVYNELTDKSGHTFVDDADDMSTCDYSYPDPVVPSRNYAPPGMSTSSAQSVIIRCPSDVAGCSANANGIQACNEDQTGAVAQSRQADRLRDAKDPAAPVSSELYLELVAENDQLDKTYGTGSMPCQDTAEMVVDQDYLDLLDEDYANTLRPMNVYTIT